jgi:dephospho-CoA kinase
MKKLRARAKTVRIGVTGSMGTGKSTVSKMLAAGGGVVIDADRIVRELMRPGTLYYRRVRRAFGSAVVCTDGAIDRAALAERIFTDAAARRKLERIIHPAVRRLIRARMRSVRARIMIVDAPLLIEAGMRKDVDVLVVVKTSRACQLRRVAASRGFTYRQIAQRIAAQLPLSLKVRMADFVIDNSGTLLQTKKQVGALRRKLWKS